MRIDGIRRWGWRALGFLVPALFLALPAGASAGNWLYVDCSGNPPNPGDFTSITAAINSLNGVPATSDYDYIQLRNDCTENVTITAPRRLWISPADDWMPWSCCTTNKMVKITAFDLTKAVLSIQSSENVTLVHLSLSGGSTGLAVGANANVTAYGVVAENNVANADGNYGEGISVGMGGILSLGEGGSLNNSSWGIMASGGATVDLYGRANWLQNTPLTISGNGKGGIRSDRSYVSSWMGLVIENNQGWGLATSGADTVLGPCCGTESVIQGNEGGAFLSEGSEAAFWGATTFRDNGDFGIYAEMGSHVTMWASADSGIVVEGHAKIGVNITTNSQARIFGPNLFRNNGSPGEPASAGVRIDGNSNAFFNKGTYAPGFGGTEVRGNTGPGILVDLNSSVDASTAVVRNNAKEGVRLRHMSVAYLGPDSTIKANGGGLLTCDVTSLAVTNLVHKNLACPNVEKPTEPRLPWPPNPFK